MIEQSVWTALSGLAGGRVYAMIAPDTPTAPFIVYQNIANKPEVTLANGTPINNTRIQIDAYAKTYAGAKALADLVTAAMAAASFTSIPILNTDGYEPETKLFRMIQDFSLWY